MSNQFSKTYRFLVVISTVILAGLVITQFFQWRKTERLLKQQEQLAEQVGTIHHLETLYEEYRPLRIIPTEKRPELYPAVSTFRPGLDTLGLFQLRLRRDISRWIDLDEELLKRKANLLSLGKENLDSLGVVREKVELSFEGCNLWSLHGYLLYPNQARGPLPGVLCLNGHRGTAEAVAGIKEDYNHGYGLALAAAGFKVLTFDWCFEGESRLVDSHGKVYHGHESIFDYISETGRTGLALYMENAFCALKALKADTAVDPARVGVTGISRGGELTTYFAALFTTEIAACYSSGAGFPFVYRRFGGGCECTYVERIFDHYEFSDLLVASAPLPCGLQLGVRDEILGYWDNIENLLEVARPLYAELGAPRNFGLDIHASRHEYLVEQAEAFLKKHLTP